MGLDVATVRNVLRDRAIGDAGLEVVTRRAAVAAIVRPVSDDCEVLLIRRAQQVGDPWSGHMAFPGGKMDPEDVDLRATAQRETLEEVGIDLAGHEFLGRLDDIPATPKGQRSGMVVAPHVFALQQSATLSLNTGEVAAAHWVPLSPLLRGESQAQREFEREGRRIILPAFAVAERDVVWGLTYRMLSDLLELLPPPGDVGAGAR